jgi:hypothetical protein
MVRDSWVNLYFLPFNFQKMKPALLAFLRHTLTFFGGYDISTNEDPTLGLITTAVALVWSVAAKKKRLNETK